MLAGFTAFIAAFTRWDTPSSASRAGAWRPCLRSEGCRRKSPERGRRVGKCCRAMEAPSTSRFRVKADGRGATASRSTDPRPPVVRLPARHPAGFRSQPDRLGGSEDGGPHPQRAGASVPPPLPPPPPSPARGPYEVDFLWRDRGLIVETDGFRHHTARPSSATALGTPAFRAPVRVLRFTHRQLARDRSTVVAALRLLLRQGSLTPNL
jgi:hypothetical protein